MIEGYYVESTDGLLFAVKGVVHPPEAVVAYLRYAPDPNGERRKEGLPYRRLYHFEEQETLLQERSPACLFFDPIFSERLQGVPRKRIKLVYDPCLKLADLRQREGLDELEREGAAWSLASCLCHPHEDVQVRALRALERLGDARVVSFVLTYAEYMAVWEGGSESATIHGMVHSAIAQILAESLRRGFFGTASVEVNVQDGTIQHIRRCVERIEK